MDQQFDQRLNSPQREAKEIMAKMSHDLRTPMSSITGFTRIALAHLDDRDRVEDCLNKILKSGEHMLSLINDILDQSRMESGKFSLLERAFSLEEVASWCASLLQIQAEERSLDYEVDMSAVSHPLVMGDCMRLKQILQNIGGNAVKFTDAGGRVHVRFSEVAATADSSWYVFRVSDTGCGMSPEFLARIYEPFSREDLAAASTAEGTGLGMAITKNLVELMGGAIFIESQLGRGTEVTVQVPLRHQSCAAAADGSWQALEKEQGKPASPAAKLQGRRMLVADDDALSREIMREILASYGASVAEASDGREAVEMLRASAPHGFDAVLMDMHMPSLDGIAATQAIRSLEEEDLASVPVIAITADAFEDDRRTALEAGLDGYVTKPLDLQQLLDTLQQHVRA